MNIFLTGATGLVGGELLVTLSKRSDVDKIFCLLRSKSEEEALIRIKHVFDLHQDEYEPNRIIPVLGNLFDDNLTDSLKANKLLDQVDAIIHSAANTSFSRVNDDLVERANIGGLNKILLWAKDLPHLKTFLYIGTATICGKDVKDRIVHEDESPNLDATHLVKYTYTKMKGELLIREHLRSDQILVARPSIIMGDSRPIMPRSPVILWAMATINHLRLIPVNAHAQLDIIPVNYAAEAIVALLFANRKHHVYHISAGEAGATTALKLAKTLESYFDEMPPFNFINKAMLNQVKHWTRNRLAPESELYSYRKYLDYWKVTFQDKSKLRLLFTGIDPYLEFIELGHVFDNTRLLEDVGIENSIPADIYINNSMNYVEKIDVLEGAIDP
ncbi:MAG: SDR family oxidoreductase [Bacteroidetes bacterium]|nr:SDR family oxidoreductase [Bacteroidota bacterium]MBS1740173.1 SDR family oxidoreductase [Bacteroidota bacterium]